MTPIALTQRPHHRLFAAARISGLARPSDAARRKETDRISRRIGGNGPGLLECERPGLSLE